MKSLAWIGRITAVISIACCVGMFYTFNKGIYSLGFVMVYGFVCFFTISVVVFRIKKRIEIREAKEGK